MDDKIFKISVTFIFLIILAVGLKKLDEPAKTPVIINIQSVNLQSEKEGKFILGLGWETGEKVYYVYKITDDGGKKLENKKVKKDAVKELLV